MAEMNFIKAGENENSIRFRIGDGSQMLTFEEVITMWQTYEQFRNFYMWSLNTVGAEFDHSYFWEHPGLRTEHLKNPYEFIIHRSKNLDKRTVDETAFAEHFQDKQEIAAFPNLGKNAIMIVPAQLGNPEDCKHLGVFMASDNEEQQHLLFQEIGSQMLNTLNAEKTTWLSTAGMGVAWLHIRLDQKPKYYRSKTYKNPNFLKPV